MSQGYKDKTYQASNYKADGSFGGSQDKTTKLRIILTQDIQEINQNELFKQTLGKSADEIEAMLETDDFKGLTGFAESEYLLFQRDYSNRTGQHLDTKGWTWLLSSGRPRSSRVPGAGWDPGGGGLGFFSGSRSHRYSSRGARLAGSFEIHS